MTYRKTLSALREAQLDLKLVEQQRELFRNEWHKSRHYIKQLNKVVKSVIEMSDRDSHFAAIGNLFRSVYVEGQ